MASTRKSKSVNKHFGKAEEEWPEKDGTNANKSKPHKKKLSDMLGPQWSKEELERFYGTYRKCGKDWRKVAGMIRNRTIEMVEALYNMNKAYLSLPEGTATAAGLIAMMTDHYNVLEGSDSERESNDVPRTSRKPQKRAQGKYRIMSKGRVDTSLSRVINIVPKVKKQMRNAVSVQLMDEFLNPVSSLQTQLSMDIEAANSSDFMRWPFVDNKDGLYIGYYLSRDLGTYNICISYEDKPLPPCPFEVQVCESGLKVNVERSPTETKSTWKCRIDG